MTRQAAYEAVEFLRQHSALHSVAGSLTATAAVWRNLDSIATRCRVRVILAPWFRRSEQRRRRHVSAWRFPDQSHLVLIPGPAYPLCVEALDPSGISVLLMRDTNHAVRTALAMSRVPFLSDLAVAWLGFHGQLPPLDRTSLIGALECRHREIRLAAIARLAAELRNRELHSTT